MLKYFLPTNSLDLSGSPLVLQFCRHLPFINTESDNYQSAESWLLVSLLPSFFLTKFFLPKALTHIGWGDIFRAALSLFVGFSCVSLLGGTQGKPLQPFLITRCRPFYVTTISSPLALPRNEKSICIWKTRL